MTLPKMTRTQALYEIRRRLATAIEAGEEFVEIDPHLQAVANNLEFEPWDRAVNFSLHIIVAWAEEVERSIAREVAKELTQ